MKGFLIYVLGFISGVVVTLLLLFIFASVTTSINDENMTFFEQPGECITTKTLMVESVVYNNSAVAVEVEWNANLNTYSRTIGSKEVLLTNDENEYYYDGQVIKTPREKCMKQVGIYKHYSKTLPIVKLMDR